MTARARFALALVPMFVVALHATTRANVAPLHRTALSTHGISNAGPLPLGRAAAHEGPLRVTPLPAVRKPEPAPPLPDSNPLKRRRMAMPVAPSGDYAF